MSCKLLGHRGEAIQVASRVAQLKVWVPAELAEMAIDDRTELFWPSGWVLGRDCDPADPDWPPSRLRRRHDRSGQHREGLIQEGAPLHRDIDMTPDSSTVERPR